MTPRLAFSASIASALLLACSGGAERSGAAGGGASAGGAPGGSAGGAASGSAGGSSGTAGGSSAGGSSAGGTSGRAGGSSGGGMAGSAGGTSGNAGGVAGTGGGNPGAGCMTLSFPVAQAAAFYSDSDLDEITQATLRSGTSGLFDQLVLKVVWSVERVETQVTVPGTVDLSTATSDTCRYCVTLRTHCSATLGCSKGFLARAGTMSVSQATRGNAGSIDVTLTNVRLEEWMLGTDTPVAGGACLFLPSLSHAASF